MRVYGVIAIRKEWVSMDIRLVERVAGSVYTEKTGNRIPVLYAQSSFQQSHPCRGMRGTARSFLGARMGTHPAIFFNGKVEKGETFTHEILDRFTFILKPNRCGWIIVVQEKGRPKENLARLTPPFPFVPNPRCIEGWHFRNADHTGPNAAGAKNVNAPRHVRNFIFSPMVGKEIDYPVDKKERDQLALFS